MKSEQNKSADRDELVQSQQRALENGIRRIGIRGLHQRRDDQAPRIQREPQLRLHDDPEHGPVIAVLSLKLSFIQQEESYCA